MIVERGMALVMHWTILEALFVDHRVRSGVPRAVTGTLVEDRVRLTHLFGLVKFHFGSSIYFAVCSVHLESGDHFQIVTTVIQSCRIVCLTHIVWFFNTGFFINCFCLVSHILILDILLGAIIGGNWTTSLSKAEMRWARPVIDRLHWVSVANHGLVESSGGARSICLDKYAILNLSDPFIHARIWHVLPRGRFLGQFKSVTNLTC